MSKPNNFNPFSEPYHPAQIPLIAAFMFAAIPGTFCFGPLDKWSAFRGVLMAIGDIPTAIKDTYEAYK